MPIFLIYILSLFAFLRAYSGIARQPHPGEKLLAFPSAKDFTSGTGKELVLILDLDSTLIYYVGESEVGEIPLVSFGGREYVKIRPYAKAFLVRTCQHFHCIVYTAGVKEYGADIVAHLNKITGLELEFRNRSHCAEFLRNGRVVFHHKNLENVLPQELISKAIILDDTWEHYERFENQKANVIQIKAWKGEMDDTELARIGRILLGIFKGGKENGKFDIPTCIEKINYHIQTPILEEDGFSDFNFGVVEDEFKDFDHEVEQEFVEKEL